MNLLVGVAIHAVGILFAALLVPGLTVAWSDDAAGILLVLVVLAVVFGLVERIVRPVVRILSLPLRVATLGLFSVLLDAGLLLAVAFLVDLVWQPLLIVGGYPPDLSIGAMATAAAGALVIAVVSMSLRALIPMT